jgi:hypothetical protein
MNLFTRVILSLLWILVCASCVDPILLKTHREGGVLVVNGRIRNLDELHQISLGYTSNDNRIPVPESGAYITIFDNTGDSAIYAEKDPGMYELPDGAILATPGRSYYIKIKLQNGKIYQSTPDVMPGATGNDHTYYEFYQKSEFVNGAELERNLIGIYTDTQLPESNTPLFLHWEVGEIYMFEETPIYNPLTGGIPLPCFVTDYPDPQRINLFKSDEGQGGKLERTLVAEREIDYTFLTRHYFIVYLSSISEEAHAYWGQVNGLINKTGSIFDIPPAPIKGNIFNTNDKTEAVFGFFEASNTTVTRVFTIRNYIPFAVPFNCYVPEKGLYSTDYPRSCSDCLTLPNSTHEKPDWF